MAIYHFSAKPIARGEGRSSVAAAAYRSGTSLEDARTGISYDYSRKSGVVFSTIIMPPAAAGWEPTRAELWNAAEKANGRGDAIIAREFEVSLPHELTASQRKALALDFAKHIAERYGVACDVAIHAPGRGGDERNHHVHILATAKRISGSRFGTKAIELDPIASNRNAATRDGKNGVAVLREVWAALTNAALEEAGHDARVDHRSFKARGIDQETTEHVGPHATAMERKGHRTERGDVNRAARERNAQHQRQVTELDDLARSVRSAAIARAEREVRRDERAATRTLDPERILHSMTEHRPTFTRGHIDRLLREVIPGEKERQEAVEALLARPEVVGLREQANGPVARYTTRTVLGQEQTALEAARTLALALGHGVAPELQDRVLGAHGHLDREQVAAYFRATGSAGLSIVAGEAGTGKSTTLAAIRAAYEAAGYRVRGLAWTNAVVQDLKADGFTDPATIASELRRVVSGKAPWDARTVLVVDEAAMLSTRHLSALVEQAAMAGAKLVLAGDDRQLPSIERGGLFGALRLEHGAAELHAVRRVSDMDQRRAFNLMHQGEFRPALKIFHEQGAIHWQATTEEAQAALVNAYGLDVASTPEKSRFVFAASNSEVASLNREIRALWREHGRLGPDHLLPGADGLAAFAMGDRIIFTDSAPSRDARAAGFINGSIGTIRAIDGEHITVALDSKHPGAEREVSFTVGADRDAGEFSAFRHGYAGTIYKGQGRTLDQTYVLHSPMMTAATSYVALSRHRELVALFAVHGSTGTPERPAEWAYERDRLAHQLGRVDDRRSASQFHAEPEPEAPHVPAAWPPRTHDPAMLSAAAVRAVAAQFEFLSTGRTARAQASAPASQFHGDTPRSELTIDAALSEAAVRAVAEQFARLLVREGGVIDMVAELVEGGIAWVQHAAQHVVELVEEARDAMLGERAQDQVERDNRDAGLDLE